MEFQNGLLPLANTLNFSNGTLQFDPRLREYFFVSALMSIVCALVVVAMYGFKPALRQHPDVLLLNRTILDAMMMLCHVFTYALHVTVVDDLHPHYDDERCRWVSFFYQFAVTGSTAWYFVISVDLLLIVKNPFRSPTALQPYYYIFVFALCTATSVTLMATGTFGLTAFDFCWISDGNRTNGFSNPTYSYSFGLYFGWSAVCTLISILIVIYVAAALQKALATSDVVRKYVVMQLFAYVVVLTLEWTARLTLWFLQNKYIQQYASDGRQIGYLGLGFAILEGSRGVVDLLVWTITGKRYLKVLSCRKPDSDSNSSSFQTDSLSEHSILLRDVSSDFLELSVRRRRNSIVQRGPHVSSILRHDLISCIAWGILDSATVDWQRREQARKQSTQTSKGLQVYQQKLLCPFALKCLSVDFTDYSPSLFTELRLLVDIDPITYAHSFHNRVSSGAAGMDETLTSGRSGSFFYYTDDRRYMVKTLESSELKVVLELLPDYHRYLTAERHSLLPRYCGLHQTRLSPEQNFIPIIVMQNILFAPRSAPVEEKYDLKGSWVSRTAKKKKKDSRGSSHVPTWKDCDLKRRFRIGTEQRQRLLAQLERDVQFLASFGLMDYSLLVGVHDLKRSPEDVKQDIDRAQRRRRATVSSAVTMPELPVDSLLQKPKASGASTPTGLTVLTIPPDAMLASYQRAPVLDGATTSPRSSSLLHSGDVPSCRQHSEAGETDAERPSCSPEQQRTNARFTMSNKEQLPFYRTFGGGMLSLPAEDGDGVPLMTRSIYYIGLIDIFQKYTLSKKVERMYKVHVRRVDPEGVSTINVQAYQRRFMRKMEEIFI